MERLLEQSARLIAGTETNFKRFLFQGIRWNNRLIGIKGARGTGKTTLVLQWIKSQQFNSNEAIYLSLDDLYFTKNTLKETVDAFFKQGGQVLALDEVHKYPHWAQEIKNIFDFYPSLKIIFTGSSVINISQHGGDLSRRSLMYDLPGLSYREFLAMQHIADLPHIDLETLLLNSNELINSLPNDFRPLQYFNNYLQYGYYPFGLGDPPSLHQRIQQLVRTIVEVDMSELADFDIRNAKKMLQLIYIIAQQVPFKPNLSALALKSGIHRNSLHNYLHFLEKAKIISLLFPSGNSTVQLQKPEKIYLNNPTLMAALGEEGTNIGNMRETFLFSQLNACYNVRFPKQGDFIVSDKYCLEVGGRSKGAGQIANVKNAWVVKDELELPAGKALPLWLFGLLY